MVNITEKDKKILQDLIQNYEISKNYLFTGDRFIIVENEQVAKEVEKITKRLDNPNLVKGILIKRENALQQYELFRKLKEKDVCEAVLRLIDPIQKRKGKINFRVRDLVVTIIYEVRAKD